MEYWATALPGAAVSGGDLQVAQELLARAGDGDWIDFPEPMKFDRIAYSGYSEYRLGNDYVLVVIEELRRSKVLLFEVKGGRLIQKLATDEVRAISLADLDADGTPEVLWDEWRAGEAESSPAIFTFTRSRQRAFVSFGRAPAGLATTASRCKAPLR